MFYTLQKLKKCYEQLFLSCRNHAIDLQYKAMGSKDDFILKDEKSVKRRLHCQIYSTFSSHFMFWIYFDECFIDKNLLHISLRPFVNLGIGTSALELELELELILQTPLFPVPLGL